MIFQNQNSTNDVVNFSCECATGNENRVEGQTLRIFSLFLVKNLLYVKDFIVRFVKFIDSIEVPLMQTVEHKMDYCSN